MISFEEIGQAILEAATEALGEGANIVAARAKSLAPVRRAFTDGGYAIRFKSMAEIEGARGSRDNAFRAGSPPTVVQPEDPASARTITGKRPPVHWRERRTSAASHLLTLYDQEMSRRKAGFLAQPTFLTRRGASEVRTKRAVFASWQHLKVGGRLRGEIHAIAPTLAGNRAEAWVISPTRYAKYQEFGTRHNAAHPFLRPAAAESRAEVVSRIAAAVTGAARTGSGKMEIEIMVRL
jgi:HK97 gp10 family phage protein